MGFYCRYVNKGSDACVFSVDDPNRRDEIKMYELGRYISANEACWRIFGSQIHHHFPPLTHLVVHLPNGQRMHFNPGENLAARVLEPPKTTLTEFFALNQRDAFARKLLYSDVPWH